MAFVLWGRFHRECFLEACLPSLLSRGNLPALALKLATKVSIRTTPHDWRIVADNPAWRDLTNLIPATVDARPFGASRSKFENHHEAWCETVAEARAVRAAIGFLPPDLVWADGAFERVARAFGRGEAAVYMSGIRATAATALPELAARRDAAGRLVLSTDDLAALVARHGHPFNGAVAADSPAPAYDAEMALWKSPRGGWAKQVYLAGPIMFADPARVEFDDHHRVVAGGPIGIDADAAAFASLTPELAYADWHPLRTPSTNAWRARKAAVELPGPANAALAATPFALGDVDPDTAARADRARRTTAAMLRALALRAALAAEGQAAWARALAYCVVAGERLAWHLLPAGVPLRVAPGDGPEIAAILAGPAPLKGLRRFFSGRLGAPGPGARRLLEAGGFEVFEGPAP